MPEQFEPCKEFIAYARAVQKMREKQSAYFKDQGTLGDAIVAERKVDRWTEEVLNPGQSLFASVKAE